MLTDDDFLAAIRKERSEARAAGRAFAAACRDNDLAGMFLAVDALNNWTVVGWPCAFREVLRSASAPLDESLRDAFLQVWIENKSIAIHFDQHFLLIDGLRKLLPPYTGGSARLYRGAFWRERCSRTYGLSWTSDVAVAAEKFATDSRQYSSGGSCVLETHAPAEAIIGSMDDVGDPYNESEFLIDRRRLGEVRVARRFAQIPVSQATAQRA